MSEPGRGKTYKASEESSSEYYQHIRWRIGNQNWRPVVYDSLLTGAVIALATAIIKITHLYPRFPSIILLYLLLTIALAGMRGSYAALLAVLLSSLSLRFFLTPPFYQISFFEQAADDLFDPWVFFAVGIIAGQVTAFLRRSAERAKRREQAVLLISRQAQKLTVLQERERLARELHDSISQTLYGINLGVRSALEALDEDPRGAVAPMRYVVSLTEAGLAEMRVLIFELHPESFTADGIVVALNRQVAVLRSRNGLLVETALDEEPELPPADKYALYRIAQEALHNIIKHADASAVTLRLLKQERELILEVVDDGKGFDPVGPFPGHLGLRSIEERADQLGGVCIIESAPAQGTRLWIRIPTRETPALDTEPERGRTIAHYDRLHPSFE